MITDLFRSRSGVIFFSILLGLALASLFQRVCKGRGCLIYNAPNVHEVKKSIYKHDDKCYRYNVKNVTCEQDDQVIHHA